MPSCIWLNLSENGVLMRSVNKLFVVNLLISQKINDIESCGCVLFVIPLSLVKQIRTFMKRIFTIFLLVVAFLAVPAAQAELRFGVKLGANVTNTDLDLGDIKFDGSNLANFTGGVTAEWIIAAGFGFDVSAMYTAKGTEFTIGDNVLNGILGNFLGENSQLKNTVHYIEVPVNLRYKLQITGVEDIIAPFVYAGPSFAFKVGESVKVGDHKLTSENIENSEIDYAFNLGLGAEIIKHLQVAVQYGWGLNSSSDYKFLDKLVDETAVKSGAWTVTVGWYF